MELDFKLIISKGSNFFFLTDGKIDILVKNEWVDLCARGTKIILIFLIESFIVKKNWLSSVYEDSAYFESPAVEMYQLIGPLEIFQLTHQINLLFLLNQLLGSREKHDVLWCWLKQ